MIGPTLSGPSSGRLALDAEIALDDLGRDTQPLGGVFENDPALVEHIGAVGETECGTHTLLDNDDRLPPGH